MPTNILRGASRKKPVKRSARAASGPRDVFLHAGSVVVRLRLRDTPTADRIWTTLPVYATAETWGQSVHFETHVETGREADARQLLRPGDIAFSAEQDRIIVAWGPTPLSKPGEIRLPAPCNIWARALDDVAVLAAVQPGQKISLLEAAS